MVLAYLRTQTSHIGSFYIPVSNLLRADLALRPELIPVLSNANLKPSDLITLSDLPPMNTIASQLSPEKTRWILVDHNALMNPDLKKIYGSRLVGCIDHHAEDNAVPKDCKEEPRVIRKSGSCMTLVVEYCKDAWEGYNERNHKEAVSFNAEVARVALGPILIDTSNLGNKAETTSADGDTIEYLESWVKAEPSSKYDRDNYYKVVAEAKADIGDLSLPDILRKDYKQYSEAGNLKLGIASVMKGMAFLVDKAGGKEKFLEAVKEFARERDLSVLSIMTKSYPKGGFARELFVWASDKKGVASAKKFETNAKEKLGLKDWEEFPLDINGDKQWQRCWWQERAENSRKQVAPLMRAAVAEVD